MTKQYAFSAASNKLAFAQAFVAPATPRRGGQPKGRLHLVRPHRRVAMHSRKTTSV